jgi:hypothetical protein
MADLILEITKLSIADRIKLVQEILSTVAKDVENQDFAFVDDMLAEAETDIAVGRVYTSDKAKKMFGEINRMAAASPIAQMTKAEINQEVGEYRHGK